MPPEETLNSDSAAKRYETLAVRRDPFLKRAQESVKYTIPTLIPEDGANEATNFSTPYQSVGAEGTNNLASKLLLSQVPPNQSFVRLVPSAEAMAGAKMEEADADIEEALAAAERKIMAEIEAMQLRPGLFEAFRHLLHGNVALDFTDEDSLKVWPIHKFVCARDGQGNPCEIITCETVTLQALPEETREELEAKAHENQDPDCLKTLKVYTWYKRTLKNWVVHQEVKDIRVHGSYGTFKKDSLPFIVLRMVRVDGEDYGRGFVEERLGDLKSLEGLMRAIVEGSAAAAKVLFLVKPNATTTPKTLAQSPNGAFRQGMPEDVTAVQLQKQGDFSVALSTIERLESRLQRGFLLHTSVQRDGERVTAEEIRYMASELEAALGGIYSLLAQEFQLPLVQLVMKRMIRKKTFPKFKDGLVNPVVVTGLEALGRGNDLNKLRIAHDLIVTPNPELAARYWNYGEYYKRVLTSVGIESKDLIRSEEEVAEMEAQAQQQALAQQVIPDVAKEAVKQSGQPAASSTPG